MPLSLPYRRIGKAKRQAVVLSDRSNKTTAEENEKTSGEPLSTVPQNGTERSLFLDKCADQTRNSRRVIMRERRQPALVLLPNPIHSALQWLFLPPPEEDALQPRRQSNSPRHPTAAALEVHLDHPLRMRKFRRRLA